MPATKPGSGICVRCEIQALIDLSFERMRAALSGAIPVIGKRLPGNARQKIAAIQTIKKGT
jgi:hypothetical protein